MQTVNPTTEAVLASYPEHSAQQLDAIVERARAAFADWRAFAVPERAVVLRAAAQRLREQQAMLAELMTAEMGKPIRQAKAEVEKCAWVCDYYADNGGRFLAPQPVATDARESSVRFDPLGVILGIMPWNFPLWQVLRFAAPTLMAGNVVLLKHATNVWGAASAIERLWQEAGLPSGAFAALFVDHEQTEALVGDRRVAGVSLTGSVRAGRRIGELAGRAIKPCVLELGGSDPCVVLADADVEAAAVGAVQGRLINSGQSCIAAKRFIVEAPIYAHFSDAVRAELAAVQVDDPKLESTDVGPLARRDLRDNLHRQVRESVERGAQCRLGGEVPSGAGFFYPPTLLTEVTEGMPAFDEETFGPLAAVVRANDAQEAIALANRSAFGLGASVWTRHERGLEVAERLEAGTVAINGIVKSDPRLPFGGVKDSGVGRELAQQGIHAFVNVKSVSAS